MPIQKRTFMNTVYAVTMLLAFALITLPVWAEPPHGDTNIINNYYSEPTADVVSVDNFANDTVDVVDLTNTSITDGYTVNECQGVAIAMAGSNNTMYMGTDKPQLSLGIGECEGDLASSLMFGMRLNKSMMINGSWATDNDINAFGIGLGVIFK